MNVSVCMATHNGERFLRQQLDSILPQLVEGDELIISDDQSTDGIQKIMNSYDDRRIKLLPPQKFGSPAKNFEHALINCSNEIIFLADQDDVWHPEKIKIMKEALTNADIALCNCRLTDVELKTISASFFEVNGSKPGLIRNFIRSSYMGCCMAFKRSVLEKSLPFPAEIVLHDQWIGLIAERHFRVTFLPQILVDHRRHNDNYSSTGGPSQNSFKKKLEMRFHLAKKLLFR